MLLQLTIPEDKSLAIETRTDHGNGFCCMNRDTLRVRVVIEIKVKVVNTTSSGYGNDLVYCSSATYHIFDCFSESSSICILSDEYKVLALSHQNTDEVQDVGMVQALQQPDLEGG
jgi:hypothetical protein